MKESKSLAARIRRIGFLLVFSALAMQSTAAPGDVDLSFDAGSGINGGVRPMALQPDGKLIIGGGFTTVRGLARLSIARLNPDGSGDPTFDAGTNADQYISAIAVQPDGKVIFTREYSITSGEPAGDKVVRLNTNGTVDASFVPAALANAAPRSFTCVALQPDGRIVLGGYSLEYDGFGSFYRRSLVIRLNANGALDNTFTNDIGAFGGGLSALALQADGKILIAGDIVASVNGTNHYDLLRLNANGTADTNFNSGADGIIKSLGLQSDGKILLAGYGVGNSTNWNGVARLNADGSMDGTFQPGIDANSSLVTVVVQSDGMVVCLGSYVYVGGTNRNGIVRLNSNGRLDVAFNPTTGAPNNAVGAIALQGDGKILIGGGFTLVNNTNREGLARLNANGTLDASFNPGSSIDAVVNNLVLQADGKVLIGGDFTMAGGATRNRVARLNANVTLDTSFDPGTGPAGGFLHVTALSVQPNGKVLVGGDFSSFNGTNRNRLARLNADGTVDTGFVPWIGAPLNYAFQPYTFLVQPDGKILVGGNAALSVASDGTGLARLNPDGSFDDSFHADTIGTNEDYAVINSLALQSDGKILAGGYSARNYVPFYLLTRLNTNGGRDPSFSAAGGGAIVTSIALQLDGKILVGGWYGENGGWISRLNTNGSADNTFNGGSGAGGDINSILLQSSGKILIAGSFTNFNGTNCNHMARLDTNGSLDTNFNVAAGVGVVSAAALQPDGNVLIAGGFITANAVRLGIARIYGDSTLPMLSIGGSNSFIVVSWPASFGNFQLRESTNLTLNSWSSVAVTSSTNNNIISVTLPSAGSRKFFRLNTL